MYLIIMDYSWGGLIKIELSKNQAKALAELGNEYVKALEKDYGFSYKDSYWMSCDTLNEVSYEPEHREALRHHASALLMYTDNDKPFICHFRLDERIVSRVYQVNGEIGVVINGKDTDWDDLSAKEQERVVQVLEDEDCLNKTKPSIEEI